MHIWPGIAGCSSIFIFASFTFPFAALTAFSRTGVSCLHGPHHGAQKSTRTGWCLDSSMTSFMKPCVVVSLTTSGVIALAPPFCSIFENLFPPARTRRPISAIDGLSGKQTQSSRHVRGAPGNLLYSGDMAGRFKEFHQIIAAYRRGHGVDQRVIVECAVRHHGGIENDCNTASGIVDCTEGCDRAWLHAQNFTQKIGRAE